MGWVGGMAWWSAHLHFLAMQYAALCTIPCFCSSTSEAAVGFLAFLYLMVHNLPQLWVYAIIFSLLQFLCILLLKEMFVQVQALQSRAPGLSLSQRHQNQTQAKALNSQPGVYFTYLSISLVIGNCKVVFFFQSQR